MMPYEIKKLAKLIWGCRNMAAMRFDVLEIGDDCAAYCVLLCEEFAPEDAAGIFGARIAREVIALFSDELEAARAKQQEVLKFKNWRNLSDAGIEELTGVTE